MADGIAVFHSLSDTILIETYQIDLKILFYRMS